MDEIERNNQPSINHIEVNGDMYALPGIAPQRLSKQSLDRPISEGEDDDMDMEIIDNSIYKFRTTPS